MERTLKVDLESRFPTGSSATMIDGLFMRAREIATLCLCPPERSLGNLSACTSIPKRLSKLIPSRLFSDESPPENDLGRQTLSMIESVGTRKKDWNIIPIRRRWNSSLSFSVKVVISLPSIKTLPLDGFKSPDITLSKVDFPQPEGP